MECKPPFLWGHNLLPTPISRGLHRGSSLRYHTHQQGWTLMDACIKQASGQSAPSDQKDLPCWSASLPIPIRILYSWHFGALYNNCAIELTRPQNMGSLPQLTTNTKILMKYYSVRAIQTANIPRFHEAFAHLSHSMIGVIPQYLHCC
jgi:hypothetical protein